MAVRSDVTGDIRYIRFSRPAKLNALTLDDLAEIAGLVRDPGTGTRALVFASTGDQAFSAGMHVATFADLTVPEARRVISAVRDCLAAVRTSPLATAAMIGGYCLGAAFELALACDLRICSAGAQFGLPEVKVGIPSVADAALLQQHVGLALAKEIILTGDLYSAECLFRRGLLNRLVPQDRLEAETAALLSRVTRHTPAVLASQKRLFEVWQNNSLRDGIDASIDEFAGIFGAAQTRQAIMAYRASLGSAAAGSPG